MKKGLVTRLPFWEIPELNGGFNGFHGKSIYKWGDFPSVMSRFAPLLLAVAEPEADHKAAAARSLGEPGYRSNFFFLNFRWQFMTVYVWKLFATATCNIFLTGDSMFYHVLPGSTT